MRVMGFFHYLNISDVLAQVQCWKYTTSDMYMYNEMNMCQHFSRIMFEQIVTR